MVCFGKKIEEKAVQLKANGEEIDFSETFKYLGVTLDKHLN